MRSRTAPPTSSVLLSVAVENLKRVRQGPVGQRPEIPKPSTIETRQASHSMRPGTSTPFSWCAGT